MPLLRRSGPSTGPRTVIGLWLRANLLAQGEVYNELSGKLNGGRSGWNDDEPAVIQAGCELASRRFFGADYEVQWVTAVVTDMRRRIPDERDRFDQLAMEAVIRAALGEKGVAIADIKRRDLFTMRGAVVVYVSERLKLNQSAIDELIVESEQMAIKRGWAPPFAD